MFGSAKKLRREKEFCGTHCFFQSLHTSEESEQKVFFHFISIITPLYLVCSLCLIPTPLLYLNYSLPLLFSRTQIQPIIYHFGISILSNLSAIYSFFLLHNVTLISMKLKSLKFNWF